MQEEQKEAQAGEQKQSRLFNLGSLGAMLNEKEQKSLLFYISIGIILVEFAVTVGALIYGIANSQQMPNGMIRFSFPWAGYLVSVVVAPVIVMLLVNLIGLGFYRAVHGEPILNEEQAQAVPERMQVFFSLVRGAPTIILLGGIIIVGAVLYYLDGVMTFLLKLGDSIETIVIWVTVGLVVAWSLSYFARMWFMYRTRRLEEEYAFRRDVLERTGMVILDEKTALGREVLQLPVNNLAALPEGNETLDVQPITTALIVGSEDVPAVKDNETSTQSDAAHTSCGQGVCDLNEHDTAPAVSTKSTSSAITIAEEGSLRVATSVAADVSTTAVAADAPANVSADVPAGVSTTAVSANAPVDVPANVTKEAIIDVEIVTPDDSTAVTAGAKDVISDDTRKTSNPS